MRWRVLDEIVRIEKGVKALTRSRVPEPGEVSPELLMIEMMAQTGGLLLGAENDYAENIIFAKIERADFYSRMKSGEKIEIKASSENLKPEGSWIDSEIYHSGAKIASARLLLMNAGPLVPGQQGSVTFHDAFMKHFNVREKIR